MSLGDRVHDCVAAASRRAVNLRAVGVVFASLAALSLGACGSEQTPAAPATPLAVTDSQQGLTGPQRDSLHHLSEGDEFIPLRWLEAIRSARTKRPFLENVERFGLIPDPADSNGLPIGLSASKPTDVGHLSDKMVGFTCASCHTSRLTVGGRDVIIEGGASHVDAERFEQELLSSVDALGDPAELARFVSRVRSIPAPGRRMDSLTLADVPRVLAALKSRMDGFKAIKALLAKPNTTRAGYGRIDAFGTSRNLLYPHSPVDMTAPVRHPKVWQSYRHKWLHWDGNSNSVMERNIGQAIAAGAVFDAKTGATTLKPRNLYALETLVQRIAPPRWPVEAGAIDRAAAAEGRVLYAAKCQRCHALAGIPERDTLIPYREVGTDPQRAITASRPLYGKGYAVVAAGLLTKAKAAAYKAEGITPEAAARMEGDRANSVWRVTGAYAARPLTGVWATAPYLHNGSVPTLSDLLEPPSQRPVTFMLGGHTFDPVKVGLAGTPSRGVAPFVFDTRLTGNANGGHTYGAELTAAQRRQLLEYLKTL